ncbi:hypothetical protein SAMN05443668_12839 [Cryptosporangium aurantiacum]|uniref:Uncharacterized protein n=1 Tax=Cryptosporangium aurantiacum TaxID=134849 RepID=A0A1M7RNL2_9ACTN|nr:hypothetical protein SAMN05443668_12839 [Cryptosporangium aurantiacum]
MGRGWGAPGARIGRRGRGWGHRRPGHRRGPNRLAAEHHRPHRHHRPGRDGVAGEHRCPGRSRSAGEHLRPDRRPGEVQLMGGHRVGRCCRAGGSWGPGAEDRCLRGWRGRSGGGGRAAGCRGQGPAPATAGAVVPERGPAECGGAPTLRRRPATPRPLQPVWRPWAGRARCPACAADRARLRRPDQRAPRSQHRSPRAWSAAADRDGPGQRALPQPPQHQWQPPRAGPRPRCSGGRP